jgi:rhamnulokinase
MSSSAFLAFDLGAESGRAVLGTLSADGKLALDVRHRFANPNGHMNGRWQWNLLSQWEELKTGLRKTVVDQKNLQGIGVDTWGVDFGLIASGGDVLGNPTMYRDPRNNGMMEQVFARVPKAEVFQTTGLQFMVFNTLYQLEAIRTHTPRLLEAAESLLFMPDLFHYLFSGRRANEFSIASTSQMLDPRTGQWATDLLNKLDLPAHLLCEIVPAGTVLAPLKADIAIECGLDSGAALPPVIAPASHDTASAVVAVPADASTSWCYISSGTWSLMGVELDKPLINEASAALNYTNEGGYGGTTRFLKNIMGLWLVQECRRQFVRDGFEHGYPELTTMAAAAKPFGPLVDPDDGPLLNPGNMPAKIDAFCRRTGQAPPATKGEIVRCCLESLALTYRRTLAGLEKVLGRRIDVIHIVGGGGQNELLNQMTADACNRIVVTGPTEATAAGNVLTQALATGRVKSLSEAREIVRRSFDVQRYEPRDAKQWDGAYERFAKNTGA